MNKLKIFSLIMAILLLILSFAGCRDDRSGETEPETVEEIEEQTEPREENEMIIEVPEESEIGGD